jgi:hypothetical protein
LIVEIAVATGTAPAAWWGEPDEVLATVIEVLTDRAAPAKHDGR